MENKDLEKDKNDPWDSLNISREEEHSNTIKPDFKREKEKLSKMSFGQKAEYIFSYYKAPIIIGLCIIALVIWGIYHAFTYESSVLYGAVINSMFVNEEAADDITEYCEMEKHEVCELRSGLASEIDPSSGSVYNEIDILTIAGTFDFQFTDEAGAQYLCDMGVTLDITEELPSELLELWSDRIVYMDMYDSDTDDDYINVPVAIDISGTNVAEYFELTDETNLFTVTNLSGADEYLDKFYQMLYEIEMGTYPN